LHDTKLDLDLSPNPPSHKLEKSYDCTQKFQLEWVAKLHWAQGVLTINGVLDDVRFKVCNTIDKKSCLFFLKWDTLMKHEGKMKGNNVNKGD
jgi:hypothetical protein